MRLLRILHCTSVTLGLLALAGTANAGGGAVLRADPMTVGLASEPPRADGSVRGAIFLELAPGWKTYWRDPGDSGIPPTIDFAATNGLGHAELHFPAPLRFGEGLARANGYDRSVAVAFELAPQAGERLGPVEASVMLGVCREICIPVQATLTAAGDGGNVQAAFAALPAPMATAGATAAATLAGDTLTVAVAHQEQHDSEAFGAGTDLFVLGPKGWYFGEPEAPSRQDDRLVFSVPVMERPRGVTGPPERVDVVLTHGAEAMESRGVVVTPRP